MIVNAFQLILVIVNRVRGHLRVCPPSGFLLKKRPMFFCVWNISIFTAAAAQQSAPRRMPMQMNS